MPLRAKTSSPFRSPAGGGRRLETAIPPSRHLQTRPGEERGTESRRLSGRGFGALRRVPYPAQRARRRARQRLIRRGRCRQLAGLRAQPAIAGTGAMGRGGDLCLFAPRLASRSRHGARADGRGGEQSVPGAAQRCPRHRDLYGRGIRPAASRSQAPGRRGRGAGQFGPDGSRATGRPGCGNLCRGLCDLP